MYEDIQFERMTKLMEFNVLHCLDTIKDELAAEVVRKQEKIRRRTKTIEDLAVEALKSKIRSSMNKKHPCGLRLSIAEDRKHRLIFSHDNQRKQETSEEINNSTESPMSPAEKQTGSEGPSSPVISMSLDLKQTPSEECSTPVSPMTPDYVDASDKLPGES